MCYTTGLGLPGKGDYMFKRFHDVEKWDRPWYRKLSPAEKCAWDFITCKCDNVGVWIPDFESAEFYIGEAVDWESFTNHVNGNIHVMDNGKWWLADFCRFQYPELEESTNSRPLLSYIALLKKHTLWKGYIYGIHTVQDKDKDKDKEKDKDKDKDAPEKKSKREPKQTYGDYFNVLLSDTEYDKLVADYGLTKTLAAIKYFSEKKEMKGYKYKSDYLAMRSWAFDAIDKTGKPCDDRTWLTGGKE
jgi:hypothetical protein